MNTHESNQNKERRWVGISRENAVRHPLYGAGGPIAWLLFVLPLNIIFIVWKFISSMPLPSDFPDSEYYVFLYYFQLSFSALTVLLIICCFYSAYKYMKIFYKFLFSLFIVSVASPILTAVFFEVSADYILSAGLSLAKTIVIFGLLAWYFAVSRRANVTFLHRVRPDDLRTVGLAAADLRDMAR
jgi:hypothetical protein